jgi:uncharacterized membrane protein
LFKLLREAKRLHETVFMMTLSALCAGSSVFRCFYTGTRFLLFLNWNLFLAFIPWALTSLTVVFPRIQKSKIIIFFLLGTWLVFFPNAPYILTDLFYLRRRSSMPIWYDMLMIVFFAWTGLLFGFLSLWDIERIMGKGVHRVIIIIVSTLFLFIASFGVYIGRYLRWNSWDILMAPFEVIYDIRDRVVNPLAHRTTWGMTLFMGLFLKMLFWSFRLISKRGR